MVTTINTLAKLYLNDLKDSGVSNNTLSNYKTCLATLCRHFGDIDPEKLDQKHLELYEEAVQLKVNGDNRKILLRYLKSLRYFLEWCELKDFRVGLTSADVYRKDKILQTELHEDQRKYQGPYVSEKDIDKLAIYWASEERSLLSLRNRAIVAVLGDGGLKVTELMKAKRKDYDGTYLKVGDRYVPLSSSAKYVLNKYLKNRPDHASDLVVGYSSLNPDEIKTVPLGIRSIQRIVKNTAQEVGIEGPITPQVLRNSRLIRALADEDLDIVHLTEYFGLTPSNSSYQRFLPMARKLKGIKGDAIITKQLSLRLGIPMHQALNLIRSGSIPATKFRNHYYIEPKDYTQYIDSRRH